MYQEKLVKFKNVENLAGKAWEHALAIDLLSKTDIKDCSIERVDTVFQVKFF